MSFMRVANSVFGLGERKLTKNDRIREATNSIASWLHILFDLIHCCSNFMLDIQINIVSLANFSYLYLHISIPPNNWKITRLELHKMKNYFR